MKKVLAFLLVGMLVFGSMAFASETRIGGLGVQPWQTLDDEAIIYSYVGQLSNYKNLALIEMNSTDSEPVQKIGKFFILDPIFDFF